ncbi:hypothetical protein CEXT_331961 [Caerostris extrusa]|uniref:Uncharacterized protein n=1 Tax=Caerostris extrusa TaxID=172846 RepID=A0AAV4VT24_CAEEX|nr:hypothetical protein CEXT_331961 [Caerostris extrusa]
MAENGKCLKNITNGGQYSILSASLEKFFEGVFPVRDVGPRRPNPQDESERRAFLRSAGCHWRSAGVTSAVKVDKLSSRSPTKSGDSAAQHTSLSTRTPQDEQLSDRRPARRYYRSCIRTTTTATTTTTTAAMQHRGVSHQAEGPRPRQGGRRPQNLLLAHRGGARLPGPVPGLAHLPGHQPHRHGGRQAAALGDLRPGIKPWKALHPRIQVS